MPLLLDKNNNAIQDLGLAISAEQTEGMESFTKFARRDLAEATVKSDIWEGPTNLWVPPTQARIHSLTSDDDEDTIAGTGARTVFIEGLNSSLDIVSENVNMNGSEGTDTLNEYVHIYRGYVTTAGTSNTCLGTISMTANVDGTVTQVIVNGRNWTQGSQYIVPAGKIYAVYSVSSSLLRANSNIAADFSISLQAPGSNVWWEVLTYGLLGSGTSLVQGTRTAPFTFKEGFTVKVSTTPTAVASVTSYMEGVVMDASKANKF